MPKECFVPMVSHASALIAQDCSKHNTGWAAASSETAPASRAQDKHSAPPQRTPALHGFVQDYARQRAYLEALLAAADETLTRRHRVSHLAGRFDSAGLFSLSEPCVCRDTVWRASKERPYTVMHHARALTHVANLQGVAKLQVQRLVRALETAASMEKKTMTPHVRAQLGVKLRYILKSEDRGNSLPVT